MTTGADSSINSSQRVAAVHRSYTHTQTHADKPRYMIRVATLPLTVGHIECIQHVIPLVV